MFPSGRLARSAPRGFPPVNYRWIIIGPGIDPWGTPDFLWLFVFTAKFHSRERDFHKEGSYAVNKDSTTVQKRLPSPQGNIPQVPGFCGIIDIITGLCDVTSQHRESQIELSIRSPGMTLHCLHNNLKGKKGAVTPNQQSKTTNCAWFQCWQPVLMME